MLLKMAGIKALAIALTCMPLYASQYSAVNITELENVISIAKCKDYQHGTARQTAIDVTGTARLKSNVASEYWKYRPIYAASSLPIGTKIIHSYPDLKLPVLSGHIDEKFEALARELIKKERVIRVNSGGGSGRVAMRIGREIAAAGVTLVVDGYCLSACANYLLPAAKKVHVEGVVGYHGGAQACYAAHSHISGISRFGYKNWMAVRRAAQLERDYAKSINIPTHLMRISLPPIHDEDGKRVPFIFPTIEELRVNGINADGVIMKEYMITLLQSQGDLF